MDSPNALVCFCTMPVSASRIAFPRLGSFSDIVDVIVATYYQIDTVRILHAVFVGYSS